MADTGQVQVERLRARWARWRRRHGGRGRPPPESLWSAAIAVARVAGVEATADAVGVGQVELARRSAPQTSVSTAARREEGTTAFVALDASHVFAGSRASVRLTRVDGSQVEVTLEGGGPEVVSLARMFAEQLR